jgi:hypothetical protein
MISRIGLAGSAGQHTFRFAREIADNLASLDAGATTGAMAILGVGDLYALCPDDPKVRIVVPLLRGHRPDAIAREQIRWAHGLVITSEAERRWLRDMENISALVVCTMTPAGPLEPSSPIDRHEIWSILRKHTALSSSIGVPEPVDNPAKLVAQACLECALAVALEARGGAPRN